MTQNELNRRVARVTRETVTEISHRGFSELMPLPDEPAAEDLVLDWDEVQADRNTAVYRQTVPLPEAGLLSPLSSEV